MAEMAVAGWLAQGGLVGAGLQVVKRHRIGRGEAAGRKAHNNPSSKPTFSESLVSHSVY